VYVIPLGFGFAMDLFLLLYHPFGIEYFVVGLREILWLQNKKAHCLCDNELCYESFAKCFIS